MGSLGRFREADHVDARVGELARRQFGVVARGQLSALGLSPREIQYRLQVGRLHRWRQSVYAVGHRRIPVQGWWMAAVLASGTDAVLSHRSAAAHWGLRGWFDGPIHVTVAHSSTSSQEVRRHCSRLPGDERTVEEGIPVTSVPRTILDLAGSKSVDVVEAMIRESEHRRQYDRLSLPHLLARYPGRRGTQRVRSALEAIERLPPGRKRSTLEERFGPFLRRHRLSQPRFNDWILLGDKRYQVDCHWPGSGLIVELDSWQAHGTRSAFRSDRSRDRALLLAGYHAMRLTWAQLDDEPEAIAADLRVLLQAGGLTNNGTA